MELPPDRVSTDVRVHDDNSTAVFLYSEPLIVLFSGLFTYILSQLSPDTTPCSAPRLSLINCIQMVSTLPSLAPRMMLLSRRSSYYHCRNCPPQLNFLGHPHLILSSFVSNFCLRFLTGLARSVPYIDCQLGICEYIVSSRRSLYG
ncbi:hypothetical protein C8Q77DRAFT_596351 [Trametes polyzona]|nr:hypothetical protein C8Q77DRAFT_596351 [Trametes polyzona]